MSNAVRFRNHEVVKQPTEKARFKVINGPDKGAVYVITGTPVGIGRGETCDVILSDLKSSRLHAELSFSAGAWQVKDLGSSNGVRLNGKEVKSAKVVSGDTVAVGETIMEFLGADAGALALSAAPKSIQAVQQDQMALLSQQERIKAITSFGGLGKAVTPATGPSESFGNDRGKTRKMVIFGAVALLAVMLMLPDQKAKTKGKKDDKDDKAKKDEALYRELASYLPKGQTAEVSKTVQMFFKSGFREYREGNYLRAKSQFETVLQIDPSHNLARVYLKSAEQSIKEEVVLHLAQGKQDFQAGKIGSAKGHYEAILRLLFKDQTNPSFIDAKEQLTKITNVQKEEG